jgi:hypothetical protein
MEGIILYELLERSLIVNTGQFSILRIWRKQSSNNARVDVME